MKVCEAYVDVDVMMSMMMHTDGEQLLLLLLTGMRKGEHRFFFVLA